VALSLCNTLGIPFSQWLPVAAVFLKLSLVMQFNSTIIKHCSADYRAADGLLKLDLGLVMFLAGSLVNHGCNPNMNQISYGSSVVFRARRPISKGEQLTCSYVTPAINAKYEERQETKNALGQS
jgi:hypothetical protein